MKLDLHKIPLFREKVSLALILSLLVLAYLLLIYRPAALDGAVMKNDLAALKSDIASYMVLAADRESNQNALEKETLRRKTIETNFSSLKNNMSHLSALSGLLKELSLPRPGLFFTSIKTSPGPAMPPLSVLSMSLDIKGDFPSIGAYLSMLEGAGRLIVIDDIQILHNSKDELVARIDLNIYSLTDEVS